jgi:putative FmdB family regulatory protein
VPTYEYGCEACGHQFELEQSIIEKPVKKCPRCGKLKARRLISQGNFILKGGGWYSDLYSGRSNKKDDKPAADPKPKEAASSSDSSPSAKAEPDKKKEKKEKKAGGSEKV